MGLPALALRLLTRKALLDQTFCGASVLDSPQDPIDTLLAGPTLTIYSGEAHTKDMAKDLLRVDWILDLSIHMHLPNEVNVGTATLDTRLGGGEAAFDILWRQIERALMVSDSPWAELWREMVMSLGNMMSRPFMIETDKGVRIQAREIVMSVHTLASPPFGVAGSGTFWARLFAALGADPDPETATIRTLLQTEVESPNTITDWCSAKALLGYTTEDMGAIGLAPLAPDTNVAAKEFTVVSPDLPPFVVTPTAP